MVHFFGNGHVTFNIHPSLLPAFKGMHAIEDMLASRAKFFGTTLHLVHDIMDSGPIVAQTVMPVAPDATAAQVNKCAYIHKIYLSLLLAELLQTGMLLITPDHCDIKFLRPPPFTARCNPALQNTDYLAAVLALQHKENVEAIA